jgi:TetR/AcrR family fatty acid metabolism transcriptional regulator
MIKTAPSTDKHTRILDAARALLVQRGFQDVALDDVAKKAGVAKGTLFLYYKSKDELFSAAFADLVGRLGENLQAVLDSPLEGRELLEDAVRVILDHFDRNKDFMAQFGVGRFPGCKAGSSSKLMDKMLGNMDLLAVIVRRCAGDGVVRAAAPEQTAAFLFGLCRSAILYNHMRKISKPLADRRKQVVDMFLRGAGR